MVKSSKIAALVVSLSASLIVMVAPTGMIAQEKRKSELESLANAEKAFAAEAVEKGFRDSFINNFADDGIGFGPHPERTREKLQASPPPPPGPRKVIFNWAPMLVDLSAAGDLGYTTGPLIYLDQAPNPRPPQHGIYFSVWQKQADGKWKVAIDMGCSTPAAVGAIDTAFTEAKWDGMASQAQATKLSGPDYMEIDGQLSAAIAKNGMSQGYKEFAAPAFRVHRNGIQPITREADLDAFFAKEGKKLEYKTIGGKVAASRDLAFTYGSVNEAGKITGYYVHVWRKDTKAHWRLVADIVNGLPG